MSTSLRPRLVNGRFGDPALFVEFAYERQAVLLDCGDLGALSGRDLLRIGTVAVSHMHIDHLIGFDALLRVNIGREARIDLFGPEGLADRIAHKLQGYSWDLADRYANDLVFHAGELVAPERLRRFVFRFSRGFAAEEFGETEAPGGIVCETPRWRLTAAILEHHGPCLGYALEEPRRLNVWKTKLAELGLAPGAWLNRLKAAIREGAQDDTPIGLPDGSRKLLGSLRKLVSITRGTKIGYATDLRDTEANRLALRQLFADAHVVFLEAAFAADEPELACERAHLTTTAAGEIARDAGARRIEPFHFSSRHEDDEDLLMRQVEAAFAAG